VANGYPVVARCNERSGMSLGARLKQLRIKKNQSLQEVADAVKMSKAHIWEIEKGNSKNPTMDLLDKLATHFGVSVSYLVGEQPPDDETQEVVALYRDLKQLDQKDREAIRAIMQRFKEKKGGT
jgi:transcriptional regulator with XRE-family HTH domain